MKPNLYRQVAQVVRIQQNLGQVKECVMRIQLHSIWRGIVTEHFILNARAVVCAADLPSALVQLRERERMSTSVLCANPIHVLDKVADLIERVPDRKLQFVRCAPGRNNDFNSNQMALWIRQRN